MQKPRICTARVHHLQPLRHCSWGTQGASYPADQGLSRPVPSIPRGTCRSRALHHLHAAPPPGPDNNSLRTICCTSIITHHPTLSPSPNEVDSAIFTSPKCALHRPDLKRLAPSHQSTPELPRHHVRHARDPQGAIRDGRPPWQAV
jgi:hypothetical protein